MSTPRQAKYTANSQPKSRGSICDRTKTQRFFKSNCRIWHLMGCKDSPEFPKHTMGILPHRDLVFVSPFFAVAKDIGAGFL
jgi:hypothetical protein